MFYTNLKRNRWANIPENAPTKDGVSKKGIYFSQVRIVKDIVYMTIVFDKESNGGIGLLTFNKEMICKYICEDGMWFIMEQKNEPKYMGWIETAHLGIFDLCG